MKVKVYSQSGKPTNMELAIKYEKDFKSLYDELYEKHNWEGLEKDERDRKINMFKEELSEQENILRSKYDMYKVVELPKSGKAWDKLIRDFGCPMTIAITAEDKKLALFLMDAGY